MRWAACESGMPVVWGLDILVVVCVGMSVVVGVGVVQRSRFGGVVFQGWNAAMRRCLGTRTVMVKFAFTATVSISLQSESLSLKPTLSYQRLPLSLSLSENSNNPFVMKRKCKKPESPPRADGRKMNLLPP